ncbi:MAG TPA: OmpA family protein, partial [Rhizomicrobium sp.]|nr:OmpA family protein [Rhizomicrobium sp.]
TMLLAHYNNLSTASPAIKLPYHDDVLGIGALGYKWGDSGFRTELELGYEQRGLVHQQIFGAGDAGGMQLGSAMFNAVYDIPLGWSGLTASIGGGVGVGNLHNRINLTTGQDFVRGVGTEFMWQGIAGLSMPIADNIDLFTDYRYRTTGSGMHLASDIVGLDPVHLKAPEENVAMLGVRWYFNSPEPSAPPPSMAPPPPPPPPPPPMPAAVKTFIVFFDFDKSDLTAKAREVVSEAVKTAKSQGMVRVVVTGHTDTVGSDAYNQALSERRAESVKDEMVREGMDGGTISIQGKSFHDPLVPTGPGVREPQNRRAVIDLGG